MLFLEFQIAFFFGVLPMLSEDLPLFLFSHSFDFPSSFRRNYF